MVSLAGVVLQDNLLLLRLQEFWPCSRQVRWLWQIGSMPLVSIVSIPSTVGLTK